MSRGISVIVWGTFATLSSFGSGWLMWFTSYHYGLAGLPVTWCSLYIPLGDCVGMHLVFGVSDCVGVPGKLWRDWALLWTQCYSSTCWVLAHYVCMCMHLCMHTTSMHTHTLCMCVYAFMYYLCVHVHTTYHWPTPLSLAVDVYRMTIYWIYY